LYGQIFMRRDLSWWYWAATATLLVAGIAGWPNAYLLATALGVVQIIHFRVRERRFTAFPVQVRLAYTCILILGAWTPLNVLHWLLSAGTLAQVFIGYCLLARCLSLIPGNRGAPLTWTLVWRTLTAPPVKGSIIQPMSTAPPAQRSARHETHA
jgi:hypothetical protein